MINELYALYTVLSIFGFIFAIVFILRSTVKNSVYILHKGNTYEVKNFKFEKITENEEIDTMKIKLKDKEDKHIVLPKNAIFTREYRLIGIPQIHRIIILKGNEITPIIYDNDKMSISEKTKYQIMQLIVRSHILGEWLYSNKKDRYLFIIIGILFLIMGILIGIVLAPHLFASTTIMHNTNSTLPQ